MENECLHLTFWMYNNLFLISLSRHYNIIIPTIINYYVRKFNILIICTFWLSINTVTVFCLFRHFFISDYLNIIQHNCLINNSHLISSYGKLLQNVVYYLNIPMIACCYKLLFTTH